MLRSLLVVVAFALAAAACGDQAPDVYNFLGQYEWVSLDGRDPSSLSTDSTGVAVAVRSGELDIGWNSPLSAYRLVLTRHYVYASGDTATRTTVFTSGTWTYKDGIFTLSGDRLSPADSAGSGPIAGTLAWGVLTVRARDHEYQFQRWVNCGDGGASCPGTGVADAGPR